MFAGAQIASSVNIPLLVLSFKARITWEQPDGARKTVQFYQNPASIIYLLNTSKNIQYTYHT